MEFDFFKWVSVIFDFKLTSIISVEKEGVYYNSLETKEMTFLRKGKGSIFMLLYYYGSIHAKRGISSSMLIPKTERVAWTLMYMLKGKYYKGIEQM